MSPNLTHKRVTAPATDPVTLPLAKQWCSVHHTANDAMITQMIKAAVSYLEGPSGVLGWIMMEQEWSHTLTLEEDGLIRGLCLDAAPVISIDSVTLDGVALDEADYSLILARGRPYIRLTVPTVGRELVVLSTLGHAAADDVPDAQKALVYQLVAAMYDDRSSTVSGPAELVQRNPVFEDMIASNAL